MLGHVEENAAPGIVQLLRQYGILFNFCLENRFYDAEFGIRGTILFLENNKSQFQIQAHQGLLHQPVMCRHGGLKLPPIATIFSLFCHILCKFYAKLQPKFQSTKFSCVNFTQIRVFINREVIIKELKAVADLYFACKKRLTIITYNLAVSPKTDHQNRCLAMGKNVFQSPQKGQKEDRNRKEKTPTD